MARSMLPFLAYIEKGDLGAIGQPSPDRLDLHEFGHPEPLSPGFGGRISIRRRCGKRLGPRAYFVTPAKERVKELTISWMSALRPSRRPLHGLLRMRDFPNAINHIPHAEERMRARLEARTMLMQPIPSHARK